MHIIKILVFLLFFTPYLFASINKNIVYVENLDSKGISLKDEFFNADSKRYTISAATLRADKHNSLYFFKNNNIKNGLAYKYGDYIKIIVGVYNSKDEALKALKNLDDKVKRNKPFVSKIAIHQKNYRQTQPLNNKKNIDTKKINEEKNSVFIADTKGAKELKKEFFNKNSNLYSISVASLDLKKNSVQNFLKYNNLEDNGLAHVYGKNRNKVRVIYGLYKTKEEAIEAIENFNKRLKSNKPYSLKIKQFQNFYNKSFPNSNKENSIVELKIQEKKIEEKASKPNLSEDIKVIENKNEPLTKEQKKEEPKKQIEKPKTAIKEIKKESKTKKEISKKIEKKDKNEFLKSSKYEDIYFVESNGEFNILNEVFLNENSSFYTIDLGEINLDESSIEEFYVKNGLKDNSLSYKYGDNKEYARVIYGAYESKEEANRVLNKLNLPSEEPLRVSNIANHQKLYKHFHKEPKKTEIQNNILYTEYNRKNILKDEFFNKNSQKYTITLITMKKNDTKLKNFLSFNELNDDTLIYSLGYNNEYYKLFYGVFDSFDEAKDALKNLSDKLKINHPYVSKISTNQDKFESYNNRKISDFKDSAIKLK